MRRLFRFKKKHDETLTGCCQRTAREARTIWTKMKLSFSISDVCRKHVGSSGMGPVIQSQTRPRHALTWRRTSWWQHTKAIKMKDYLCNHTRWKHKWRWHNRGCVFGTKSPPKWCGKEEWNTERKKGAKLQRTREISSLSHYSASSTRCCADQTSVKDGNQTKKGNNQDN